MNLSYWEYKSWFSNVDYTVIGSGIVGLTTALRLREKHPKASILILEKGILPQGASTKNAGFACFGSISEILADLKEHSEEELVGLVDQRWKGIKSLRSLLGDTNIGYQNNAGHEIFLEKDEERFQYCYDNISVINELLTPVFQEEPFKVSINRFGFEGINQHYITHIFEGQIDTGRMMKSLLAKAMKSDINILNSALVESFLDTGSGVEIKCNGFQFKTNKLLVATNGFAQQLFKENVRPARAQVIITKPIKNLHIKGTFHLEEGYYYFRNIDDRILLGGGRNLDFKTEETFEFGQTSLVRHKLKELLATLILPRTPFKIDYGWSGIMGVGPQKKPIVKQLSDNVACGVRLGGMGVAIGASVGERMANIF
ncbi:FAD-binding oxidoreductase [Maribacter sp. MMG018]|uniref:NAD(P)/FAD-dependent oxidoreductase n=1 Tax=Maribacter sp. MMG018 TaxID=2822688 RepID=UPI001B391CEC|nr:FAD-dependent oxidoreductase [Maribacter sp. MMG018]MBQ4913307.1 FAD-binding oxidoreductase [Maribacter sp. MMG018]